MGRVARYKKIKSFDPYSKENAGRVQFDKVGIWGLGDNGRKPKKRSKTSEKLRRAKKRKLDDDDGRAFDVPPEEGDDFDLADLVGSLKKQTPVPIEATSTIASSAGPVLTTTTSSKSPGTPHPVAAPDDAELKEAKLLKIEQQLEKKSANASVTTQAGRMEGETKRAYHRRVKVETRQIIKAQKQSSRNPEKKKRKKEFLNSKKKGKGNTSSSVGNHAPDDNDDNKSGTLVTAEQAVEARARETAVRFGEQAERPPTFRQLPRGATRKGAPKTATTSLMNDSDIAAEQRAMELMRRKTLAQYAAIKARRRQEGDFHL